VAGFPPTGCLPPPPAAPTCTNKSYTLKRGSTINHVYVHGGGPANSYTLTYSSFPTGSSGWRLYIRPADGSTAGKYELTIPSSASTAVDLHFDVRATNADQWGREASCTASVTVDVVS
jgi:hypothetical protein